LATKDVTEDAKFPTTAQELHQMQVNKDVADILKYVYQDPKAYYEVNAAIYSEYYDDESVMLRDLLFPETSPLYQFESFKKYKSPEGLFKKRFFEALSKGDYPVLKEAMGLHKVFNNADNSFTTAQARVDAISAVAPMDTAIEIYSNSMGTSIYFPYSENFGSSFTPAYFDNVNTDPWGQLATIISADREANSAPGSEPYKYKTAPLSGEIVWEIRYRPVTVNDAYAEVKVTHIVGGGADIMCHVGCTQPEPLPGPQSNRVFMGWIRIQGQQLDNLISLSKANGGGAELKIGRSSGYLKMEGGQVTDFQDIITPDKKFKRKDIKKGRWRKLYAAWDPDWKADNKEQVLAAWEADNKGEQTFTGSLTTTLKNVFGANVVGAISYSIKVVSDNPPFYRPVPIGRFTTAIPLSVGHYHIILTKILIFPVVIHCRDFFTIYNHEIFFNYYNGFYWISRCLHCSNKRSKIFQNIFINWLWRSG